MYRMPYVIAIEMPSDWMHSEDSANALDRFVESLMWSFVNEELVKKYGEGTAVRVWAQPAQQIPD